MEKLQIATALIGIIACLTSFTLAYLFFNPRKRLSMAVSIMLFCEGLMGGVTVLFAISALTELGTLPPNLATFARICVFICAGTSSLHLSIQVLRVMDRFNNEDV